MKFTPNTYLKRVASAIGAKSTTCAVQTLVGSRRGTDEPLEAFALRLGVSEIVEEALTFDGGLYQTEDNRLVIKLDRNSLFVRKRFTLAHEIGHLLLGTLLKCPTTHGTDQSLERACDLIAAELLMPTESVSTFVWSLGSPSPEKLRIIASEYCVSLQAAAIRVHDLRLWKCCVGFWEGVPRIRNLWFVGPRRWDAFDPDAYSIGRALSSSRSVRTSEVWRRGPYTDPVGLNLLRIGEKQVLGLVGFSG